MIRSVARAKRGSAPHLLLYSVNTFLAYRISEDFYGGLHYVWCTPCFDSRADTRKYAIPPSANPCEIYSGLYEDSVRGDRHSSKISENKTGILAGADARMRQGEITARQLSDIAGRVMYSDPTDFRPLLFVIPYAVVRHIVKPVPLSERAHPRACPSFS